MSKECKKTRKRLKKHLSLSEMFLSGEELVMKRIIHAAKNLTFSKVSDPFHQVLDHAYAAVFQINQFYKRTVEIITEELYSKKVPKDQAPERAVEKIIREEFENARKALDLDIELNKYIANEEIDDETKTNEPQHLKEMVS